MWKKTIVILGVGISFIGCSKDAAKNVVSEPELNGSFLSPCQGSELAGLAIQERLTFSGDQFTREETYFQSAQCDPKTAGGTIETTAKFIIDADGLNQSEAGAIRFELKNVLVTPKKEFLTKALNTIRLCGKSNYTTGKEMKLNENSGDFTCPVQKVPETVYGAYKLDGSKLYFNEGGIDEMTVEKSKRPLKLNKKYVYIKK